MRIFFFLFFFGGNMIMIKKKQTKKKQKKKNIYLAFIILGLARKVLPHFSKTLNPPHAHDFYFLFLFFSH